jgi:hypothetical protein
MRFVRTLPFFLECEFALLVVVFVLSSTSVFTTLYDENRGGGLVSLVVVVYIYMRHWLIGHDVDGVCEKTHFPLILRHIDEILPGASKVLSMGYVTVSLTAKSRGRRGGWRNWMRGKREKEM